MAVLNQPITIFASAGGGAANIAAGPPVTGVVNDLGLGVTEVQMRCTIKPEAGRYDITGVVNGANTTYLHMSYEGLGPNGHIFLDNPQ